MIKDESHLIFISYLLSNFSHHADDTEKVIDSKKNLEKFGRVYRRWKLRVNVAKSKVKRFARCGIIGDMNVKMDGKVLEEEQVFKYLGSLVTAVGGVGAEVQHRV